MKTYIYKCKDGRTRVVIKNDDGTMTSKSYPRILMEEKLGRPLEPNEDVHHVDGNKENNSLDNLELSNMVNTNGHIRQESILII